MSKAKSTPRTSSSLEHLSLNKIHNRRKSS